MTPEGEIRKRCDAARRLLETGDWSNACQELEVLPAEVRATGEIMVLHCTIYACGQCWHELESFAAYGAARYPDNFRFFTHWAWALHRQGRTSEGLEVLAGVAERFAQSGATAYAIACLNGALGRVQEARHWLLEALQRHETDALRVRALNQPELACVWEELRRENREMLG